MRKTTTWTTTASSTPTMYAPVPHTNRQGQHGLPTNRRTLTGTGAETSMKTSMMTVTFLTTPLTIVPPNLETQRRVKLDALTRMETDGPTPWTIAPTRQEIPHSAERTLVSTAMVTDGPTLTTLFRTNPASGPMPTETVTVTTRVVSNQMIAPMSLATQRLTDWDAWTQTGMDTLTPTSGGALKTAPMRSPTTPRNGQTLTATGLVTIGPTPVGKAATHRGQVNTSQIR